MTPPTPITPFWATTPPSHKNTIPHPQSKFLSNLVKTPTQKPTPLQKLTRTHVFIKKFFWGSVKYLTSLNKKTPTEVGVANKWNLSMKKPTALTRQPEENRYVKYIRIFLVCVALYYFLFYIPDIRQPKAPKKEESLLLQHLLTADEADYVPTPEATRPETTPLAKLSPAETLDAQIHTANFLAEITKDDEEKLNSAQEAHVVEAFNALVTHAPDAKNKILEMQLPEEVRSSVAMLSQYQWKFIEQAEELRNMAVAKIVKETDHPDARIRLKALDMLGKVTEVALFTERVEHIKAEVTDEELERRIKEKLGKYMGIVDVSDKDVLDIEFTTPDTDTDTSAEETKSGKEDGEKTRSQKDGEEE